MRRDHGIQMRDAVVRDEPLGDVGVSAVEEDRIALAIGGDDERAVTLANVEEEDAQQRRWLRPQGASARARLATAPHRCR